MNSHLNSESRLRPAAVLAAALALVPTLGAGAEAPPALPETVIVHCGDLALLLRSRSQWTPGRIDFRGVAMSTERSAYGTVFSFPGVGFIGTGHLENEPEEILSLVFRLDGELLAEVPETLAGETFRLERESRVRSLHLSSVVELKGDRLYETAVVRAGEDTPQNLIYHFMHAWVPTVSEYLAGRDGAPEAAISGRFGDGPEDVRRFHIREEVDWMAVFEPESERFAVSRLLEYPEAGGRESLLWNVPGTYRKYYLKCFADETVPAGFEGVWRMVTGFGESGRDDWREAALALAESLRESP